MSERKLEGYEMLYARQTNAASNLSSMYGRCIALLEYAAVALEGKAHCDNEAIAQRIKIAIEELEVGWSTRYEKKD